MRKHTIYIVLVSMLLCLSARLAAQDVETTEKKRQVPDTVYCGVSFHVDIASPFMGLIVDKHVRTLEGQVDVNLFNKLFPIIEGGYGQLSTTAKNGSLYKTSGTFLRFGLNYNFMKLKDRDDKPVPMHNYPFVGLRYGMSFMNYSLRNVEVNDDYWGGSQMNNYSSKFVYAGWLDIVAGVRVDVYRGFTMGWSVRIHLLPHASKDKAMLWYIPGCGRGDGASFTLNYTLGFHARTKAERDKVEAQRLKEKAAQQVTLQDLKLETTNEIITK